MKVFIDTNVWLRFLLADVKEQFAQCLELFSQIEAGKFRPYTSSIVLLEIHYVLAFLLKIKKEKVLKDIQTILQTRNLKLIEKTDFEKAFQLFTEINIKLVDCLIATQLPQNTLLCSFDQGFKKVKGLQVFTPGAVLRQKTGGG